MTDTPLIPDAREHHLAYTPPRRPGAAQVAVATAVATALFLAGSAFGHRTGDAPPRQVTAARPHASSSDDSPSPTGDHAPDSSSPARCEGQPSADAPEPDPGWTRHPVALAGKDFEIGLPDGWSITDLNDVIDGHYDGFIIAPDDDGVPLIAVAGEGVGKGSDTFEAVISEIEDALGASTAIETTAIQFAGAAGCHVRFDASAYGDYGGLMDTWTSTDDGVAVIALLLGAESDPPDALRDARTIAASLLPAAS